MSVAVGEAPEEEHATPAAPLATPKRVLFVTLVAGAAATLVATVRYGIGLTPDSVVYLQGAHNLSEGHGFTATNILPGQPPTQTAITQFAPAYSMVLSIGDRLGIDAVTAARIVAVLTFAATTLLAYVLLRRYVRDDTVVMGATVVVGCSAVLLMVFTEAVSEHLFLVDIVALLIVVTDLRRRPTSPGLLALAVALVWAGFYLRFAGIVLLPYLVAGVVITGWRRNLRTAIVRGVAVAVIGVSVPLLWMLRNVDAGSAAFGGRQDAAANPFTNIKRTVGVLGTWLVFGGPLAIGAVVFIAVAGFVVFLLVRYAQSSDRGCRVLVPLWPLAMFVAGYVGYLIGTASVVAFGSISTRFLSPVFVPLVVVGAWTFERALPTMAPSPRRAVTVGVCVWIALSLVWFAGATVDDALNGAGGYATAAWHDSAIMRDIRAIDPGATVFSNDPRAVELFTGRQVLLSPQRVFFNTNESTTQLPAFIRDVSCSQGNTLAWFVPNPRSYLYSLQDLERHVRLVPKIKRPDGVIYDIQPLPSAKPPACPHR